MNIVIKHDPVDSCPFRGSRNSCSVLDSDINHCPTTNDDCELVVPCDCPLTSDSITVSIAKR